MPSHSRRPLRAMWQASSCNIQPVSSVMQSMTASQKPLISAENTHLQIDSNYTYLDMWQPASPRTTEQDMERLQEKSQIVGGSRSPRNSQDLKLSQTTATTIEHVRCTLKQSLPLQPLEAFWCSVITGKCVQIGHALFKINVRTS